MKKATCQNLRGACAAEIFGNTPEEMGENCKQHVMKLMLVGDEDHKAAMNNMMMLSKEDQLAWYADFKRNFASLPDA